MTGKVQEFNCRPVGTLSFINVIC